MATRYIFVYKDNEYVMRHKKIPEEHKKQNLNTSLSLTALDLILPILMMYFWIKYEISPYDVFSCDR